MFLSCGCVFLFSGTDRRCSVCVSVSFLSRKKIAVAKFSCCWLTRYAWGCRGLAMVPSSLVLSICFTVRGYREAKVGGRWGGGYVACCWVDRCYACDRESSLFAAGAAARLAGRVVRAAEVGLACCVFPVLPLFSAPRVRVGGGGCGG